MLFQSYDVKCTATFFRFTVYVDSRGGRNRVFMGPGSSPMEMGTMGDLSPILKSIGIVCRWVNSNSGNDDDNSNHSLTFLTYHSNEIRAPIANLSNNAQLGSNTAKFFSVHSVYARHIRCGLTTLDAANK